MNNNAKPMLIVIGFAALLVALFAVSLWLKLPIAFRPPNVFNEANLDAYNQAALEPGATGVAAIDLYLQILAPSVSESERRLAIAPYNKIGIYVRDDHPQLEITQVCVDTIQLFIATERESFPFLAEPVCHTFTQDDWFGDYAYDLPNGGQFNLTNHWYADLPEKSLGSFSTDWTETVGHNFWFPYDSFSVDLNIQAQTTITLSDGSTKTEMVPIYYQWKLQPSGSRAWDASMKNSIQQYSADKDFTNGEFKPGYYQLTSVAFKRPTLYLFAFPVLIIGMVIFIALVPLMIEAPIDRILTVQTGLLFATFAVRSILSPGKEIGQTLIEVSIIGLNLLQIFAALILYLRIQARKKEKAT